MAKRLAAINPKTGPEFEKVEAWKDFVLKTADSNEKTIVALESFKTLLEGILADAKFLEVADLRNRLEFQSDTIHLKNQEITQLTNDLRECYKANLK